VSVTPFEAAGHASSDRESALRPPRWIAVSAAALLLVGAAIVAMVVGATRVERILPRAAAPLPELTVERVVFRPGEILVSVRNTGRVATRVSQVAVDDAFRLFDRAGDAELGRLGDTELRIPYPWIAGEPVHLSILAGDGTRFDHHVEAAALTPTAGRRTVAGYAALGGFIGVLPVFLGLAILPVLGRLRRYALRFVLGITGGMLVFLAVDAWSEALDAGRQLAPVFRGQTLAVAGAAGAAAVLVAVGQATSSVGRWSAKGDLPALPYLVAGSIGLHNLGEGLAVGSAHARGEFALGAALVAGFAVHNLTEGFGIGAVAADERPSARAVLGLGLLAGLPTVVGTLLGGLAYSPFLGTLALAVGVGAVVPVVWQIGRQVRPDGSAAVPLAGAAVGYVVMYLTALGVAA
jgi:zinc transporter, ZIP family